MQKENEHIIAKIARIIGKLGAISKSKKQGSKLEYGYQSIDEVINELNPLMSEEGIVPSVKIIQKAVSEFQITDKYDNVKNVTKADIDVRVIFSDGFTQHETEESAIKIDYSDKAVTQAISMCYKYALIRVFLIKTKDNLDPDEYFTDHYTPATKNVADQPIKPAAKAPAKSTAERAKDFKKSVSDAGLSAEFDSLEKDTKNGWFVKWDAATDKAAVIAQLKEQINVLKNYLNK